MRPGPLMTLLITVAACSSTPPSPENAMVGGRVAAARVTGEAAEVAIRVLVATQFASQNGVWQATARPVVSASAIGLQSEPVVSGVIAFRGIPPRDHWHAYVVVSDGESLCPAGGFTSPRLRCVVRLIRAGANAMTAGELARRLTVLGDPNGGLRVVPASEAESRGERAAADAWVQMRPRNWPRDTAFSALAGGTIVRITVLSQRTRSYTQAWQAVGYDFHFDDTGELVAWSRRLGDPLVFGGNG